MAGKFFRSLKKRASALKQETLALWFAARDPRTPWYAKALAVLVTAYAFSPIDLIPDFIPILGYLDDLVIIPAGVALVLKLIPPEVMAESRSKAADVNQKPVNWAVGAAIILVWAAIFFLVIRAVVRLIMQYNGSQT